MDEEAWEMISLASGFFPIDGTNSDSSFISRRKYKSPQCCLVGLVLNTGRVLIDLHEKGVGKGVQAEAREWDISDVSLVPKYPAGVWSLYVHGSVARGPRGALL